MQRLAAELPGVGVPAETHFFSQFVLSQPHLGGLTRESSDHALRAYVDRGWVEVDPVAWRAEIGSDRAGGLAVFAALLRCLTPGQAVRGEKSPAHLRWLSALGRGYPDARFIAVTRDPRAVVSSAREVPWGSSKVAVLAERWRLDQDAITAASHELGGRLLWLRFEAVVTDPSGAQDQIARHLGLPGTRVLAAGAEVRAAAESWKAKAWTPADPSRIDAWVHDLSRRDQATVDAVGGTTLRRLGYAPADAAAPPVAARLPSPSRLLLRARSRWEAHRIEAWIRAELVGPQ